MVLYNRRQKLRQLNVGKLDDLMLRIDFKR